MIECMDIDDVGLEQCLINAQENLISMRFTNGQLKKILVDNDTNKECVYKANSFYRQVQFRHLNNKSQKFLDGCLPIKFLKDIRESPKQININTRYLLNVFVEQMKLIFEPDFDDVNLFQRDDTIIQIPISDDDMVDLCTNMMEELSNSEISPNDSNIQILLRSVLQYLLKMKSEGEKSEKQLKKIKKNSNMIGRINQDWFSEENFMNKMNISDSLKECNKNIHTFIIDNRKIIKTLLLQEKNIETTVDIMRKNRNPLYIEHMITFDDMFTIIGQMFYVIFHKLAPQHSFILSLYATFYNAAYLYQLKIMHMYSDIIFLPIIYRLTHCCFYNNAIKCDDNYIKKKYPEIISYISKLQNDIDINIEWIAKIANKLEFNNAEFMDSLFWNFNDIRKSTIEYYITLLTHIFLNTNKCKTLNKLNKKSNVVSFIKPIYNIFLAYKSHVTNFDIETALSTGTLDNFNMLYKDEITNAINEFSKNIL